MTRLLRILACCALLSASAPIGDIFIEHVDNAFATPDKNEVARAEVIRSLGIATIVAAHPAVATKKAVRLDPPSPPPTTVAAPPVLWSTASSNGHCVGFEFLLSYFSPGWSVTRMSGIMYRESRCTPTASNSCCSGLLQMHYIHIPNAACGVFTRKDYYDPVKNICAAAALWKVQGYGAWSTS